MFIQTISLQAFRNFKQAHFKPAKSFNLIIGSNGSGKTSLLEALYLLSVGRSFRTSSAKRLIQHNQSQLTVFAELKNQLGQPIPIGIEKSQPGKTRIKVAHQSAAIADIAALIPCQILNTQSFHVLTEGPKYRRQFIDWGLFHVKQSFLEHWRTYQNALKQRNYLLKHQASWQQIYAWDQVMIPAALHIDRMRAQYIQNFIPKFFELLNELLHCEELNIDYYRGWPHEWDYEEILSSHAHKDFEQGYTQYGIHRGDLKITIQGIPAAEFLSRGQQKIFVWAMLLTQGRLLEELTHKRCIFLIDDLPSELDSTYQYRFMRQLNQLSSQVFITGINQSDLAFLSQNQNSNMFHVKHDQMHSVC